MKRIAIIGAGAAGCFCAARLRELAPQLHVDVYEAGEKPLAKVAVTGGGRCNLTNTFAEIRSLAEAYPRGERLIRRLLKAFSQDDARAWFEAAGVPLTERDAPCIFPASQDAMDIVRALLRGMDGARLHTGKRLASLEPGWTLRFADGTAAAADAVVVTTGGGPKGLPFLEGLEIETVPPVPSLFTFTIRDAGLRGLMGLVVPAAVSLPGTGFRAEGPLLITDWGLSGPAALKLSSYAARHLAEAGYRAPLAVNWLAAPENTVRERLEGLSRQHPQKRLCSIPLSPLPGRLWDFLLGRAGLREHLRWAELGTKGFNRLAAVLTADSYTVEGKSRFREEFVTCGGVALSGIDLNTLACKSHPGLYFAGEVLDIDAITGGFNLQAAWSTGDAVARALAKS